MKREHSIPLFLWIALAICVHLIFGGGADEASERIEEKLDIRDLAREARTLARAKIPPIEVELEMAEAEPEKPKEPEVPVDPESPTPKPKKPKDKKVAEAKKPDPKKVDPEKPKLVAEKPKPKLFPEPEKPPAPEAPKPPEPPKVIVPDKRVAVKQHVEPNQEDNPTARFAAEEANRVEKETQARITSTDQNDKNPTAGKGPMVKPDDPGNSKESRVASSQEQAGEKVAPPPQPQEAAARPNTPSEAQAAQARQGTPAPQEAAPTAPKPERAQPELLAGEQGTQFGGTRATPETPRRELPRSRPLRPIDILGYGSEARTARGVRLNLTPEIATAVVGADTLSRDARRRAEQRLSQHRGAFQDLGIERWRAAIENYVATVQPGNQTALNSARVPFANYLNEIHNRIHPIFAEAFLLHLASLPGDHPLNNMGMSTFIEIALSAEDGHIVKMGVAKSSGVTMFDVGALDSVKRASPFGMPPSAIISSDGNVYLHWEFHRREELACSTYFAHPFLLNLPGPGQAPTAPPPSGEQHGTLAPPEAPRGP